MCAEKHDVKRIPVETRVLEHNDEAAARNRALFEFEEVVAVNFMSAPGAGKTTLLEKTLTALKDRWRLGVIEGDLYTDADADRIRAAGIPAHQITTGTVCHLDARMVQHALHHFPAHGLDVLCIENVGNMVCPAEFDLGEHLRVMVYSVTEGAEKPLKYPLMFHKADAVVLNKMDLLPHCDVSLDELLRGIKQVNPRAAVFPVSCRTGEGLAAFREWLTSRIAAQKLREQEGDAVCA